MKPKAFGPLTGFDDFSEHGLCQEHTPVFGTDPRMVPPKSVQVVCIVANELFLCPLLSRWACASF